MKRINKLTKGMTARDEGSTATDMNTERVLSVLSQSRRVLEEGGKRHLEGMLDRGGGGDHPLPWGVWW